MVSKKIIWMESHCFGGHFLHTEFSVYFSSFLFCLFLCGVDPPRPPIQICDDKIIDTLKCIAGKSLFHSHFKCVTGLAIIILSCHCGSIEDSVVFGMTQHNTVAYLPLTFSCLLLFCLSEDILAYGKRRLHFHVFRKRGLASSKCTS